MIDHGDEQVEEQRRATHLHLMLQGAAALESVPAADDESEVMRTQLRVAGRGIGVGVAGGGEDGAALDAGLQTLLLEGETLEVGQSETVS